MNVQRIQLVALLLALVLGFGCSDDADSSKDGGSADDRGSAGDLLTGVEIKGLTPEKATLKNGQPLDIEVELTKPAPAEIYVLVVSKDPAIEVVHAMLVYRKLDTKKSTTIQAKKLTHGKEVEVEFKLNGTNSTAIFKATVQRFLPDAGAGDS